MSSVVDEMVQQRCWGAWRTCVSMLSTLATMYILASWLPEDMGNMEFLSDTQDIIIYILAAILFALHSHPRLLHPGSISAWYALLMVPTVLVPLFATDLVNLLMLSAPLFLTRLIFSVWQRNSLLVLLLNALFSASTTWGFVRVESCDNHLIHLFAYALLEGMASVCVVIGTYIAQRMLRETIREGLCLRASRNDISAATSLLNAICDAVVELDKDQKIVEHSARFASIFTLEKDRSVQGWQLQDFMSSEEDQARFSDLLLSPMDDTLLTSARATHVRMRDSIGNIFSMDVFVIQFQGSEASPRYLVGVREVADEPVQALPPRRQSLAERGIKHREAAATEARGTPARTKRHHLNSTHSRVGNTASEDDSEAGTTMASSLSEPGFLIAPHLRPTSATAMADALISLISLWNVPASRMCCPYHSATLQTGIVVKRLTGVQCIPGWQPVGSGQCRDCGILVTVGMGAEALGTCPLCSSTSVEVVREASKRVVAL